MQVKTVPLGSVTIGPPSWSEATLQSIRRAELLVRQSRSSWSGRSSGTISGTRRPQKGRGARSAEESMAAIGQRTGATVGVPSSSTRTSVAPFPPPFLRELCAGASSAVAGGYMRRVREVEGRLRRQVGVVSEEGVKLERERSHVEKMLSSIRTSLTVNRRSSEQRCCMRTMTQQSRVQLHKRRLIFTHMCVCEQEEDGADFLLQWERKQLISLKHDLEAALGESLSQLQALAESSRRLQACASERALVLELTPCSGSTGAKNDSQTFEKTDPISPFTPECNQALQMSSLAVSQSQQLRQKLRLMLTDAIAKQEVVHTTVNDGLMKKMAETVTLQQNLSVSRAVTRHATYRKQREVNSIRYSQGRAQGPERSSDLLSREKLTRPMVQVYQRHQGTQRLPEAKLLIQGCAMLSHCLRVSEDQLTMLQTTSLKLLDDLRAKTAAAQVDAAIVRMRRQQVDKRAVAAVLQQGATRRTGTNHK
ncbi:coiled-coil domain-containing protein 105 isoform X1 [Gouania willdenowi]|uniref:coiled-coil domain-containing protein 105 isoform X1 n=1 Tax=Gouania willdenowi TaxID=441366 RepID=UPI001056DA2A|nr:coiled-coil domain-containing protein 105 isoform X1 [Gouania willdenowi]